MATESPDAAAARARANNDRVCAEARARLVGWRPEPPVASGWYAWLRDGASQSEAPNVVRTWLSGGDPVWWCEFDDGGGLPMRLADVPPGWWFTLPTHPGAP